MFNKRRKFFKKTESNRFELKKPNTKAKKIILFFEIILILVVLIGIGYGTVRFTGFSFARFLEEKAYKAAPVTPEPRLDQNIQGKAEILIEALPKEVFAFAEIQEESENELRILSTEGISASFSFEKDMGFQLNTLQNLLTKAKINKKKVKSIDLRFDKAVVIYGK